MNRTLLGLAIGAGYALGRTRKLKMAIAVGTFVAGKRMNLSPGAVVDLVSQQLKENPQFKEIGDELRADLRGVGKAASGALVERQIDALADRLHDRTSEVRDQLAGTVRGAVGTREERDEEREDEEPEDEEPEDEESEEHEEEREEPDEEREEDKEGGKRSHQRTARKASAQKTAKRSPAKKAAAGRTAKKAAPRAAHAGERKGGGER